MSREGVVEAHFLKCPYCGDRANLTDHRCLGCGALAAAVRWEPSSPELALVTPHRHLESLADFARTYGR